ncbi:MAG: poly(3-hydroxyalkanoate) depolymerase [Chloroflexi bacterium]|nr:poly(3-hydroxyalkanoate) depolymerase [Chloroflexota bacterium]MBP8059717.1 poly(3-hydroxyalkanoate) depolymerase [Chloroflexota bacterium]
MSSTNRARPRPVCTRLLVEIGVTLSPTSSNPSNRTIKVKGYRLHVTIRPGESRPEVKQTPLLLINGIGANLELLQPVVDALDPTIEVIRFDVPGVGASPAPLLPYRPVALAWLIMQMLKQLGYAQVDVLGISWGGGMAQQFARQYSRYCRRLVLVSTSMGMLMVPGHPRALLKLATPHRYIDQSYMEMVAPDLYGGSARSDPEMIRGLTKNLRAVSTRGYLYQLLAGVGWTSLPWLPFIQQPTLIMAGNDDPIIPLVNAKIMQRLIPHAQLHVFNGGHLGLITHATELVPIVAQFLRDGAKPVSANHSGVSDKSA